MALTGFAVTAKLICAFVFAYVKCWFSHDIAHILTCARRPALNANRLQSFTGERRNFSQKFINRVGIGLRIDLFLIVMSISVMSDYSLHYSCILCLCICVATCWKIATPLIAHLSDIHLSCLFVVLVISCLVFNDNVCLHIN